MSHIMSTKKWLFGSLILVLLLSALPVLSSSGAAQARQSMRPLVLLKDGDLWTWSPGNATLTQLTQWGYNERPVISPDGTRVAYNSWATITVEAIEAGKPVVGLIPSNIWVINIDGNEATRVADQPPGATFLANSETPDRVIMRGTPEWSPDGQQLAWAEFVLPDNLYRLMVYDFRTNTTRVLIPQLPRPFADAGHIPIHDVAWSITGLAILNGSYSDASGQFKQTLHVYDAGGAPIGEFEAGSADTELLFDFFWIAYNGSDHLGLFYRSGKRILINPITRTDMAMPGVPELYNAYDPVGGMTAITVPSANEMNEFGFQWQAVYPDRSTTSMFNVRGGRHNVTLAPNPNQTAIAYWNDALYLLSPSGTSEVPNTRGAWSPRDVSVVWAPTSWRVAEDVPAASVGNGPDTSTQPGDNGPNTACGLTPRLTPGGPGRVLAGLPNIVRSAPSEGGTVVGRIPGTGVFSVLEGPVCGPDSRYWWRVNYQGIIGWTPEGEGSTYWLEPYLAGQPANQIVCSPVPRLSPGSVGYVLPGTPNILRDAPKRGTESNIVGQIPGGALFTVVSGPQCGPEGRYWYQIDYQGVIAWTPEGDYNSYWIAPFSCGNSPAPRLRVNVGGYVLPGDPNTLRTQPIAQGAAIGSIPPGGVFGVIGGPVCGPEGWTWWRVNYQGQIGWTAEGQGSTYWLDIYPGDGGTPVSACRPEPRLQVNSFGQVTPGRPNALRNRPGTGTNSAVIGEIPAGGVFRVMEGPVCAADGRHWWRISYYNLNGWTAEGEGSTYWLQPYSNPIVPTPVVPVGCSLTPRLQPSMSAFVTTGSANAIRSVPSRIGDSVVVGEIPGGSFFRVLSGPVCGPEGRYWWQISYSGITGWTAEGEGTEYWLSPMRCASSLPSRLLPGISARVTPGDPNVLRSSPGTGPGSAIVGSVPGGASFTVIGGPQCGNDGRIWWQINYGGQIGWTAEGDSGRYWLEPLN